jgi:flagellar biosynthesis protein FlhF
MQVRKFEAKTMKDALEMVKFNLGPEAIILSAKDNSRGFGLMGERSVEITAAVSDETLRRKKIADTKLKESQRLAFSQASAQTQKKFIDRVHERRIQVAPEKVAPRPPATQRYIDIADEEHVSPAAQRIRDAAERARSLSAPLPMDPRPVLPTSLKPNKSPDVVALESQIVELKGMLEHFQRMPQTMLGGAHPGFEEGLPYDLSFAFQRLKQAGVQTNLAVEWLKPSRTELDREQIKKAPLVDAWLVQKILRETNVSKDPTLGKYQVFLGTTGQGKTTTLVKMASQLVLKEKKRVVLVSLDTMKVGAADQLKIYAQILNVPFAIVRHPGEWRLLEEKIKDVHHILVDAPGLNLRTLEEMEWLKQLLPPSASRKIHFVQSTLARDEECFEIASRYRMIGFDDVIFTRLDETVQHGLILNFQKQFQVPLHSFGTGPQIPEDYEWATKERVVDLIFKISKLKKREVTL